MKVKTKKSAKPEKKVKEIQKEVPAAEVPKEEEEEVKEVGVISDGVLDAFEETAPVDPLLVEDELGIAEEDDDDEEDLDYNPAEW